MSRKEARTLDDSIPFPLLADDDEKGLKDEKK